MADHHLILGGGGFIGRHVALRLARLGFEVVIADRTDPTWCFPPDVAHRITWQFVELASADWDSVIAKSSVIHHYAWTSLPASANANPSGDLNSNVTATLALLEALRRRGAGRLVFASSGGTVYGKLRCVPVPEDHPLSPITAYGAGKAAVEIYLGLYRSLYGMDCRIARLANPFGVGQNLARGQGAATTFLHHALNGQPIVIWGDGSVVRDYIHVTDAADALVALTIAHDLSEHQTFNIGSGAGVSLNQIVIGLEHNLARTLEVHREPARAFDVPVSVLDITRARDYLGWRPRLSFSQGLKLTMTDIAAGAPLSLFEANHNNPLPNYA